MPYFLMKLSGSVFPNYKEINNLNHSDPDHDKPDTENERYTPKHSHVSMNICWFPEDPSLNVLLQ